MIAQNKFHILPFLFFLLLIGNFACSKPCDLTPATAPELRGFKLGMTMDEIKKKYPNMPHVSTTEFGLSKIYFDRNGKSQDSSKGFTFVNSSPYPEFEGTRRVYLEVIDGKIAEITVVYPNDIKWKSDSEFIQKTAESLNIPGTWSQEDGYQRIQCKESLFFKAGIRKDYTYIPTTTEEKYPFIEISNIGAQMQPGLKESKKKEEANKLSEAQKNTFTP